MKMSSTTQTLEKKRPMEADLLNSIGSSNGCTVGGSIHSVVIVGDLIRGHRLMMTKGKAQRAGKGSGRSYIAPGAIALGPITRCFLF
jgi:hypothetical protein